MMLGSAAFCENGLCVILGDEVEDLPATLHFKISPIAYWVAPKLQDVAVRYVARCSSRIHKGCESWGYGRSLQIIVSIPRLGEDST